jgi:hypothetical protein
MSCFRASHVVKVAGPGCAADQSFATQLFSPGQVTPCLRAKAFLSANAVPYEIGSAETLTLRLGENTFTGFDEPALRASLREAGLPPTADPAAVNGPMVVLMLFVLVFLATMVYGPLGALLVELFPTQVRYSGVSLALQLGNGWIGGFALLIAASVVVSRGDVFAGLWYTVAIAASTAVIGAIFLRETRDNRL